MLTKSVKSVISVVLKHVEWVKESVQSVRSVSNNIRVVLPDSNHSITRPDTRRTPMPIYMVCSSPLATSNLRRGTTDLPTADLSPKGTKSPSARMVLMALRTHSKLSLISTQQETRKLKLNATHKRCISLENRGVRKTNAFLATPVAFARNAFFQ